MDGRTDRPSWTHLKKESVLQGKAESNLGNRLVVVVSDLSLPVESCLRSLGICRNVVGLRQRSFGSMVQCVKILDIFYERVHGNVLVRPQTLTLISTLTPTLILNSALTRIFTLTLP